MTKYRMDRSKYVDTPDKCTNMKCGRMLKSKKKYRHRDVVELGNDFWTLEKECKACGTVNVSRLDK